MLSERKESEAWLDVAEDDFYNIAVFVQLEQWHNGCYFACMSVEKFGKYLLLSQNMPIGEVKRMGHNLREIWQQVETLYGFSIRLTDLRKELHHMSSYVNEKGPFSYRYPKGAQIPSDFLDEYQFQIHHRVATQARDLASSLSERTI